MRQVHLIYKIKIKFSSRIITVYRCVINRILIGYRLLRLNKKASVNGTFIIKENNTLSSQSNEHRLILS